MPFAVIFVASSSGPERPAYLPLGASVDRPLERVRGAPVVRAPSLAQLGDDLPPSLDRAILPQFELRAPAVDLKCHGGELRHGSAIEGIVRVERPEAAFGLVSSEEPLLLGRD